MLNARTYVLQAGVILGPSVMGQVGTWAGTVFPGRSLLTLETVAHLGLLYFLFLFLNFLLRH